MFNILCCFKVIWRCIVKIYLWSQILLFYCVVNQLVLLSWSFCCEFKNADISAECSRSLSTLHFLEKVKSILGFFVFN